MIVGRNSPKPHLWWTFGTVAIIFALALLWLAFNGGGSQPNGAVEGTASLSVTSSLRPQSSNSQEWKLSFLPLSLAPAQAKPSDKPRDNLTALTLGAAGVLALTGMALLVAWKRRPKSSYSDQGKRYQFLSISRRASSF